MWAYPSEKGGFARHRNPDGKVLATVPLSCSKSALRDYPIHEGSNVWKKIKAESGLFSLFAWSE